jgi:F-type H+-transporting ATPase subunit a
MTTISVPTLASETIFQIGSFDVRNTMLMAWLSMAVLIIVALCFRGTGYKMIPGRFQSFIEMIIEMLYNFFNIVLQNEKHTRAFFALPATIFLFLITANWMGILPGVGAVTISAMVDGKQELLPLFRSMNADVNMTLVIALISMITVQVVGITTLGVLPYAGKYFVAPWKDPIGTFVGLLELMGEFARVISFTFRLFGNIFAGEVLLVVVGFLVPYIAPIPFLGLEIFVGFVQSLVFAVLTLVFLKMAMTGHGEHGAEVHA